MKILLLLIFTMTISFSDVLFVSGDNGEQFAKDMISQKCGQPDIQAVYRCNGNVVKVIYVDEEKGSTFYRPDGRITNCPPLPPPQLGAECLQMLMPNYCPDVSECGNAEHGVFPGHNLTITEEKENQSEDQSNNQENVKQETAEDNEIQEADSGVDNSNNIEPEQSNSGNANLLPNRESIAPTAKENTDDLLGFLTVLIVVLGILTVVVLFLLFKKSINE